MSLRTALRRPRTWLIGLPVLAVLLAVVGPFVYINFIQEDPPERLSFEDSPASSDDTNDGGEAGSASLDGTWSIGGGSQAGYRVDEILFGQDTEAVGRTSSVTGDLAIAGTTVETAAFTVDMTTVTSDESRRDDQFHGRIMDTATYPTATFELTEPIDFRTVPDDLVEVVTEATGTFTIRGQTQPVTFRLDARRNGGTIEANGAIPITFAEFGIPDATFGPATVQDHGEIEFLLVFRQAG